MRQQFTSSPIRVLVSDDSRFHTELLADALKRDGGLHVTTSTSGYAGLTARPNLENFDILLLSSTLDEQPGRGFEVLRALQSSHAYLRAVMLLDSSKEETVLEAFRSGARGVLGKHEPVEVFGKCLRRVHEGQIWANSQQMLLLTNALASSHAICAVDARGMNLLSKRELEIVRSVAQGLTNREIAKQLDLSPHTVKNCLFRIFDKLGVSSRVELLLMTMSRDREAQSAFQYLLENRGDLDLHDEATLVACLRAAEQGVLMAQLALAQFYSANRTHMSNLIHTYGWYSVVCARISAEWKDIAKTMTVDQLLEAEQFAEERLGNMQKAISIWTSDKTRRFKSTTGAGSLQRVVNQDYLED